MESLDFTGFLMADSDLSENISFWTGEKLELLKRFVVVSQKRPFLEPFKMNLKNIPISPSKQFQNSSRNQSFKTCSDFSFWYIIFLKFPELNFQISLIH
jgi:hypothetical protein